MNRPEHHRLANAASRSLFLRSLFLALALAAAVIIVYWPVLGHPFVEFDDPDYVTENAQVQQGLTWSGIVWALKSVDAANWHPITWLSHMLDVTFYHLNPRGHHWTSILLHAANSALLFWLLRACTGSLWRSAVAAALFGLHPLRVESVAWVAERKDVLSGFFALLTLWAYAKYYKLKEQQSDQQSRWYGLAVLFFALGLMSKSMLVTLPFVLLLLDIWPLKRFSDLRIAVSNTPPNSSAFNKMKAGIGTLARGAKPLVIEKIPFFALSAASCVITLYAQGRGGAVAQLQDLSLLDRAANAAVSVARYLGKIIWPANLAVFYPHPRHWPAWQVAGAALGILLITWSVARGLRRAPHLAVGWLWFLGMLIPVIGLVQVGSQSMADRYTYLPSIGLTIAAVWGLFYLTKSRPPARVAAMAAAVAVMVLCGFASRAQTKHWRSASALFEHAATVTGGNYVAHTALASVAAAENNLEEALRHCERALRLRPDFSKAHLNLGITFIKMDRLDEGIAALQTTLKLDPRDAEAHNQWGLAMASKGDFAAAAEHFRHALRIRPGLVGAVFNLAHVLEKQGQLDQAIQLYNQGLSIKPEFAEAHINLGAIYNKQGQLQEAIQHFRKAIEFSPQSAAAHHNLGNAAYKLGHYSQAMEHYSRAAELNPREAQHEIGLGMALAQQQEQPTAIAHFRRAIELDPDAALPRNELAWILATHPDPKVRDGQEAVRQAERACELSRWKRTAFLGTLDAAYAANGQFEDAIKTAQKVSAMAKAEGNSTLAEMADRRLELYRSGKLFFTPTPD